MINNTLFRYSRIKNNRKNFNPEGFDLATVLKAKENYKYIAPAPETQISDSYVNAFADCQRVELTSKSSETEKQLVVEAAYKQVFGNAHLMQSERFPIAESQVRNGQITVMEFVRQLATSDRYRTLFFESCTNLRAIELNFKHLLGRAPEDSAEISKHIRILAQEGFEAEIDSYLDSDEYFQNFATTIVPYYRGYKTQAGQNLAGYTHSYQLLRGACSSDKSNSIDYSPKIQSALLSNKATEIDNPLSSLPTPKPTIEIFRPVEDGTKDLDINSYKYKVPEFLDTPLSPTTWLQEYQARQAAATFPAARKSQPVKLFDGASGEEVEIFIRAAYKQVFGNVHLMESQRLLTAESKLKDGQLTIKDFIRQLAKSDAYRCLFFENCSNVRAIELNFKHLLGRAPENSQEISEHSAILLESGFEAEIDSYLDSQEYQDNFGTDTIPYYISYTTQTGKNIAGYNNIFKLTKDTSDSDRTVAYSMTSSQRSQLQQSLLKKTEVIIKSERKLKGSDLDILPENDYRIPKVSYPYTKAFAGITPKEFFVRDYVATKELIIEGAYKQVFGNAHLMESERFPEAESQLLSGEINVIEFVRLLAKSDRYRTLFFENCTNLRAIELNFKHLLGRSANNYAEISEHIQILAEQGFDAEIDSYLDSDEYTQNFGVNIVPYYRGYKTQIGKNLTGYTHSFQLLPGASSSDKSVSSSTYTNLDQTLLSDRSNKITSLATDFEIKPSMKDAISKKVVYKIKPSKVVPQNDYPIYSRSSLGQPITDTVQLIRKVLNVV